MGSHRGERRFLCLLCFLWLALGVGRGLQRDWNPCRRKPTRDPEAPLWFRLCRLSPLRNKIERKTATILWATPAPPPPTVRVTAIVSAAPCKGSGHKKHRSHKRHTSVRMGSHRGERGFCAFCASCGWLWGWAEGSRGTGTHAEENPRATPRPLCGSGSAGLVPYGTRLNARRPQYCGRLPPPPRRPFGSRRSYRPRRARGVATKSTEVTRGTPRCAWGPTGAREVSVPFVLLVVGSGGGQRAPEGLEPMPKKTHARPRGPSVVPALPA